MPSPQKNRSHDVGDEVYAKWPGSNLWFRAKVLDNKDGRYTVRYMEGTEETISQKHISAMSNFARSSRSRSRSRSRGRSPGRKSKASPSASRKAKQSPSPARKPRSSSKSRSSSKTRAAATPSTPTRQSARLAEKQYEPEKKVEVARRSSPPRSKARREDDQSLAGPVFALLGILLSPVMLYTLNLLCAKDSCKLRMPTFPKKLSDYFDSKATMIVLGWFLFQVVLAALPVGRVISGLPVRGSQKLKYRCNGSIALVLSLVAMAVGHVYFKVKLAVVHTLWLQLISAATVLSLVLSLALYIQARKAKPSAVAPDATGNILVDFWVGRELNPRIRTFDWKLFMIRFAYLSMLAVDVIFLVEAYTGKSGMSNYPFLLVAGVQVLHCAVQVLNEDMFLTMPDITKMGLGFMFSYGFVVAGPFGSSIQARYLLEHPQTLPLWALVGVALLNLFGFVLYQSTVSQNARFTRNPYDPTLSHLESMPTSVPGERLLVSGMWGMCRHPLYFAELVLIYAWSLACGFSTPLVYVFPVLMTLLCVDSVSKEEAQASKKYGSTWDRCCQRVKYKLIPFVY